MKTISKYLSPSLYKTPPFFSFPQPYTCQDLFSNSPYHLPYNYCDVSSENLALDQLIIP